MRQPTVSSSLTGSAFYGEALQLSCERLLGRNQQRIDYRHVIWSLVRKPGAFARYVYREEMFPSLCSVGRTTRSRRRIEARRATSSTCASCTSPRARWRPTSRRRSRCCIGDGAAITRDAVKAARRPASARPTMPDAGGASGRPRELRRAARARCRCMNAPRRRGVDRRVARDAAARAQAAHLRAPRRGGRAEGRARGMDASCSTCTTSPSSRSRSADGGASSATCKNSDLPAEKTLATLERQRLPAKVAKLLPTLCEGGLRRARRQRARFRAARPRQDAPRLRHRPRAGAARLPRALHRRRSRSSSGCSPPSATCALEKELAALDGFDASSSTTSATSSRAATRWRCSSPSSPSATSAGA